MGGFQTMGGAVPACLVLFSFFAAGCEATSTRDLTRNLYIYRSPDYRAARRTPEAVFVQQSEHIRTSALIDRLRP